MNLGGAIDIARTMKRHGLTIEQILATGAFPSEFQDDVRAALAPPKTLFDVALKDEAAASSWMSRIRTEDWYYWSRLRSYLLGKKCWHVDAVDSIEEWSGRVLGKLPDPRRSQFLCRGLVVGYVQSGKTANFTAVVARAADAGYRLIIVLSGIHNELRKQTQDRLDQELTGNAPADVDAVGRPDLGRLWVTLTTSAEDFPGRIDPGALQGTAPVLAVVKKHCGILRALVQGLRDAGTEALANLPTLVIDDEADQASVNTGGDRPPADHELDLAPEEFEGVDPDTEPSRTNGLIRELLDLLPARAYVGYTATPFANVLTNPGAVDHRYGHGLYPADFVLQLPKPAGYCGAEELFGLAGSTGRNVVRIIPQEEADSLRPKRRKLADFQPAVPAQLGQAIDDFVLAGAMRLVRGQSREPNTMLVHTSHYTAAQRPLTARIRRHVEDLRADWRFGGARGAKARLEARWIADFLPNLNEGADGPGALDFGVIVDHVSAILERLEVRTLNSETGEELGYASARKAGRQLQVIAVGGNRLSRGLTLEGLTVSYYLRTTNMCDTLLQMARWFGFRQGFEDLLRLYLTEELVRWFTELALMEADLRDEIYRLNERNASPQDMGIRVRSHSSMLVTSRLKMKYGTTIRVGYSGQHPQTIVFPLDNLEALQANVSAADALLAELTLTPANGGGAVAMDVAPSVVLAFLRRYAAAAESRSMDLVHLCRWIESQVAAGDLVEWAVYVDGREDLSMGTVTLGGTKMSMVNRSRLPGTMSIGTLLDAKHEAVDLPGGPEAFRRERSYDADAMRRNRPRQRGLLLLYPISPESRPLGPKTNRVALFEPGSARPPAVIGFGLSLPHTDDDSGLEYVVGNRYARDER